MNTEAEIEQAFADYRAHRVRWLAVATGPTRCTAATGALRRHADGRPKRLRPTGGRGEVVVGGEGPRAVHGGGATVHEDGHTDGLGHLGAGRRPANAPRACEAMQPSHRWLMAIASAMSSLVFASTAPGAMRRRAAREALQHVGDGLRSSRASGASSRCTSSPIDVCDHSYPRGYRVG